MHYSFERYIACEDQSIGCSYLLLSVLLLHVCRTMLCYLSQAYGHSDVLARMVVVYGCSVAMMHAVNMLT